MKVGGLKKNWKNCHLYSLKEGRFSEKLLNDFLSINCVVGHISLGD